MYADVGNATGTASGETAGKPSGKEVEATAGNAVGKTTGEIATTLADGWNRADDVFGALDARRLPR